MARGVADVVEVVVFTAGAHALLRGHRTLVVAMLLTGENVLELHHAGVGEHQRRVVARHERRRGDDLVTVLGKVVQECAADLVDTTHCRLVDLSIVKTGFEAMAGHDKRHADHAFCPIRLAGAMFSGPEAMCP